MKDKILFKTALTFSIIGILILFYITDNIKIEEKQINQLTDKNLDEKIKVSGEITKVRYSEKTTFLEIKQENKINIVLFELKNFSIGNRIEIEGKVDKYNDKYEIVAEKISLSD